MIIHVDMDAFYASVEERDRPELVGRPVVVGGSPEGRGVVAAANYVVRRFGVHSAMPASTAKRLCPEAIFLPSRLDYYAQVSRRIHDIFRRYTPLVEPLSLDEAFLDVSGSRRLYGSAVVIARQIKREIRDQLVLVASAGVAPNKFLAKLASDLDKPDGFVAVDPNRVQEFLDPLPVERLWGVGRRGSEIFGRLNVRTIGQLRRLPVEVLRRQFGKSGDHFWRLARGIDNRPVVPDRQAKSISHETTFETDIDDTELLRAWLFELTEQVTRRLRRSKLRARTVHIKVRFADFRTITRSQKLPELTNATDALWQAAAGMLSSRVPVGDQPVRLLGMGTSGLDGSQTFQGRLFDRQLHRKQTQLDDVSDRVKSRFGSLALRRASSLEHDTRHHPTPRPEDDAGGEAEG